MRRFILLIDTIYYMQKHVVIEAEVPMEELFDTGTIEDDKRDGEG